MADSPRRPPHPDQETGKYQEGPGKMVGVCISAHHTRGQQHLPSVPKKCPLFQLEFQARGGRELTPDP